MKNNTVLEINMDERNVNVTIKEIVEKECNRYHSWWEGLL